MRALVIDDSRVMRMILTRMLDGAGLEVREAADGAQGLAALDAEPPDLVLVDWHMPVMSGIEFVTAARRAPYSYQGRIMMVTTETEASQIAEALEAGADEYVMKPFDEEAILTKLRLLGIE